jgi:hypothetical protein
VVTQCGLGDAGVVVEVVGEDLAAKSQSKL